MEASTTKVSAAAQLLVSISDLSMLNDIKKAISMLKGVTAVKKQKQKEYDITKTKAFKEALDDVKHGRVTHYDSVDDMFKSVLGEEAFSKIRSLLSCSCEQARTQTCSDAADTLFPPNIRRDIIL